MQFVGLHLQKVAVEERGPERDKFARSAYNRYYYAVYLDVREMFAQLDASWARTPHKSYSEILEGQVTRKFKEERRKAYKNGDSELVRLIDDAQRAARALASLMQKANGIRVVADYEPAEAVIFSTTDRFSLKNIGITEAHGWQDNAKLWIRTIQNAWNQISV